jgi:tape measure domain-containing protein
VAVATVDIQVNSQGAVRNLNQVAAASKATQAAIGGLRGGVAGLVGAFTAAQAIKFIFTKTAELETQTRSLQTLTGSVEQAKKMIAELQQLGAVTPFTSSELIDAAKRLQAFGVEGEKVVETTRRLADVSGATGAELQGLVTAYGQVQAKGRLQGEELLQFQERGISLQEELRKMYGLSGDEFQKALSKGRIGAEAVEVAIIRLTDKGGKYANGAIAQSTTLAGKFSTLMDGIESIAKKIGEVLKPALQGILNLSIAAVDEINKALSGPDYKKANDQLFNTKARIVELTNAIKEGEKAGIGLAKSIEMKGTSSMADQTRLGSAGFGTEGQILGGVGAALPGMKFELQQREKEAKQLIDRLKELRVMAAPRKPSKPPETPALLEDTTKPKTKQLSTSDLLGGSIKRKLDEARALLETSTAQRLGQLAGQPNAEQAKRMVEFSAKYRDTQLQINAIDTTLTARAAVRSRIIASSTDKASAALAFDEQSLNLKTQRNVLEQQILQTAASQSTLSKQQYAEEAANNANALKSLQDEQALLQAKLAGNEAEVILNQQIRDLKAQFPGLNEAEARGIAANIGELKKQISAAEQMKQIYGDIGMTIKSGVVDAIQGAVDGTKSLGQVANDVLKSIANKVLDVAINFALFGAMSGIGTKGGGLLGLIPGLDKRARGGPVSAGTSYMVGERGPELFTPKHGGSIVPNNALGGGSTSVVVNVDASGSSVQGDQSQGKQLGLAVSAAVQAELIKQQRPGGLLAGTRR